ncbi:MAG: thiamine pyrophosphate-dependent enzyme [Clostridia bacterium]|jgi:pyruvate ferredoxin oxidoreductase beta subunit|nr:thiamine pyrophosphate-dependent enzyme [Clostridia bacterium]
MTTKLKDLPKDEFVLSGNGACGGCPATLALRIIGKALGPNAICILTPSCTVASMGMTPATAYNWPSLNVCFATAGSSASGVVYAFESLKKKGKIEGELPTVFNWVGDGGTYDIGLQALSAAAERNDNFIHFCYNNEAYSNTGVQRSGATPRYAYTTTTPKGKREPRKSMPMIMLEHNIPYVATASLSHPEDLYDKVVKAKNTKGFKYIEVLAPCYTGWQFAPHQTIEMSRMAVKSGAWLLWEAEYGNVTLSAPTKRLIEGKVPKLPMAEYISGQGRFSKMLKGEDREERLAEIQSDIDREMEFMKQRAAIKL